MAENDGKVEEWKYDFAWKQLENAQTGNERLDNKAMSMINFSSLIIPIITAVFLYIIDKSLATKLFYVFIIVFLLVSIIFAFKAIWLRDQGIICTYEHFNKIGNDDIINIMGNTAEDFATWQKKIVKAGIEKGENIERSGKFFILALILIFFSAIYVLLF